MKERSAGRALMILMAVFSASISAAGCDCASGDDDDPDCPCDDDTASSDDTQSDDTNSADDAEDDTSGDDSVDDDTSGSTTTVPSTTTTTTTTVPALICFEDADLDGYGNSAASRTFDGWSCPSGWVLNDADCDDADGLAYPGAVEFPDDGVDQDCDGGDLTRSDDAGVFVSPAGDDAGAGTMSAPLRTIAAAMTKAMQQSKSVFAAEGVYGESVQASVSLFGGYEPVGWTRDISGHPTSIVSSETIPLKIAWGRSAAVEGFTVQGGSGLHTYGIYADYGSQAVLARNVVRSGASAGYGASSTGVYVSWGAETIIAECDVEAGSSEGYLSVSYGIYAGDHTELRDSTVAGGESGGQSHGVYVYQSYALAVGSSVRGGGGGITSGVYAFFGAQADLAGNRIDGGAGGDTRGLYLADGSSAVAVNNIIDGGSPLGAHTGSQGVYLDDSTAVLVNNVVLGGSGSDFSSGAFLNGTATMVNNILDGGAGAESYGLRISEYGGVSLVFNDVYGESQDCLVYTLSCMNSLATLNDCWWGGCHEAWGNISDPPMFADQVNGDFHILEASLCRDAGDDPILWYSGNLAGRDFEGDVRPYDFAWDIGADEWTPAMRP